MMAGFSGCSFDNHMYVPFGMYLPLWRLNKTQVKIVLHIQAFQEMSEIRKHVANAGTNLSFA